MGIRLQADKEGRPVVVSVRCQSEAAAQGVVPGLLLKSVQGVVVKSVEYQVVIDWIASLEERPVVLKFKLPKVTPPADLKAKRKSEHKSDKKSKKHKRDAKSLKKQKKDKKERNHKAPSDLKRKRDCETRDTVPAYSRKCAYDDESTTSDNSALEPELGPTPAPRRMLGPTHSS